jgi:glucose-1-phosphate thymidylyltransferase
MKTLGIIIAGGKSTRLYPATLAVTKQLLPIYDKPLIYYPLSVLLLAGIRNIALIVTPEEENTFKRLFKDAWKEFGIVIRILTQEKPVGIPDAFNIVHRNIPDVENKFTNTCLILGDNIYYGSTFGSLVKESSSRTNKATIFAHRVADPERFGVVDIKEGKVLGIEEKPENPKSNLAVTGLYFYPINVFHKVKQLIPSKRNELEITDLNMMYLRESKLEVQVMRRGMSWFDAGTPDSLLEASHFVQTIQKNQNILVCSPHEIVYRNGWLSKKAIEYASFGYTKTEYYKKLMAIIEE